MVERPEQTEERERRELDALDGSGVDPATRYDDDKEEVVTPPTPQAAGVAAVRQSLVKKIVPSPAFLKKVAAYLNKGCPCC